MFSALLLALAVTGQARDYNLCKPQAEATPGVRVNTDDTAVSALDEAREQVRSYGLALARARERVRRLSPQAPTIAEANPRYMIAQRPYATGRYPTAEPGPPPESYSAAPSVQLTQGGSCYSGAPAQAYSAAPPAQYAQGGSCYSGSAQNYSTGASCYSGSAQAPYSSPMVYSAAPVYQSAPSYAAVPMTYRAPVAYSAAMSYGAPRVTYGSPMSYGAPMSSYGSLPVAYPIGGMGGFSGASSGGIMCLSGTCQ